MNKRLIQTLTFLFQYVVALLQLHEIIVPLLRTLILILILIDDAVEIYYKKRANQLADSESGEILEVSE